jgi:hypothetical protein
MHTPEPSLQVIPAPTRVAAASFPVVYKFQLDK